MISCKQFNSVLTTQLPVYDKKILKDIRPTDSLMGFFQSEAFDAYTGVSHTFDRFNDVFPDVTQPWTDMSGDNCSGTPCDDPFATLSWGSTRETYTLQKQSWQTQLLCFDEIMTKTAAKEQAAQILEILRRGTVRIMDAYLLRRQFELASKTVLVAAGLPNTTLTWDAGGYVYLNSSGGDPTGRITPSILQSYVQQQWGVGAIDASTSGADKGFDSLQFHTDVDTFHYCQKQDPTLLSAWRFGEFAPAAKEYYKYGLNGYLGDYKVRCLLTQLRFNKVSAGRYQQVLPYKNAAATIGLKDNWNTDYDNAQYCISYITNPRALTVKPFRPERVNPEMPFLVRDYGGRWRFATNDLGADCNGKPISNFKQNKGLFYADWRLAIKRSYPEWLIAFFHKRDKPCITIIDTCNPDPGYPSQVYKSDMCAFDNGQSIQNCCPSVLLFTPVLKDGVGTYEIAANTITCNGNVVTHAAITGTSTIANLVLQLIANVSALGTWAAYDATTIQLDGSTCATVNLPFQA